MRVLDVDVCDVAYEPYWWVHRLGDVPDWSNYEALVALSVRYPQMYDVRFWCVFSRISYRTRDVAVLLVTKLDDYVRGRIHAEKDTESACVLPSVVHRLMHSWRTPVMDLDVNPVLKRYFSGDIVERKDETDEKPAWLLPYVRIRLAIPYTPDLPLLRRTASAGTLRDD